MTRLTAVALRLLVLAVLTGATALSRGARCPDRMQRYDDDHQLREAEAYLGPSRES